MSIPRCILVLGAYALISSFPRSASAEPWVWYDEERQAIAIDTYAFGWGAGIEVDFNADHQTAGIIVQEAWGAGFGFATAFGVYAMYHQSDDANWTVFGWGEVVADLAAVQDFSTLATSLYDGTPTSDGFHYFTPVWDVGAGDTVIYVQPASAPVTEAMLADTYIRFAGGRWLPFAEVPEPPLVEVALSVSPATLSESSGGDWITAKIELPTPHAVEELELDSLALTLSETTFTGVVPIRRANFTTKPLQTHKEGAKLVAKFGRAELLTWMPIGEATVYVVGRLRDGTPFRGSTVVSRKPPHCSGC